MLFLDKRIYKKTYLLLDKGFTVSKIKKKIKQYYMVNLKITSLDSGIKLVRSATKNNILILQQIYSEQFGMERKRKRIKEGRSETIIETPLRRLYSPDYNNLFGLGN